jgi:hypothetical protein
MKMALKSIPINKLLLPLSIFLFGCEHLDKIQVKGEVTGTKYSSQQFTKGKHIISATYPLSETVNIKGKVAQPYISNHSIDAGMPDYGETGLEILF